MSCLEEVRIGCENDLWTGLVVRRVEAQRDRSIDMPADPRPSTVDALGRAEDTVYKG